MASADADALDTEQDDPVVLDLNRQVRELPRSGALAGKSGPDPEERGVQVHPDDADCIGGQESRVRGERDHNTICPSL